MDFLQQFYENHQFFGDFAQIKFFTGFDKLMH